MEQPDYVQGEMASCQCNPNCNCGTSCYSCPECNCCEQACTLIWTWYPTPDSANSINGLTSISIMDNVVPAAASCVNA